MPTETGLDSLICAEFAHNGEFQRRLRTPFLCERGRSSDALQSRISCHCLKTQRILSGGASQTPPQGLSIGCFLQRAFVTSNMPHPSEEKTSKSIQGRVLESQGQQLALTVVYVLCSLDSGRLSRCNLCISAGGRGGAGPPTVIGPTLTRSLSPSLSLSLQASSPVYLSRSPPLLSLCLSLSLSLSVPLSLSRPPTLSPTMIDMALNEYVVRQSSIEYTC